MIFITEETHPSVKVELTETIGIDGRMCRAGEVVTVSYGVWLNLQQRRKAVLSQA